MQIHSNIPTNKEGDRIELKINNDSILLKIFQTALPVFITISALTVFAGVRSSISDYTASWSMWVLLPCYVVVMYLAFNLDSINSKLMRYLTASVMDTDNRFKTSSIIIIIFCIATISALTYFSYSFSQFSGVKIGLDIVEDATLLTTDRTDTLFLNEVSKLNRDYESEREAVNNRYDQMIVSDNRIYDARIRKERAEIKRLKKARIQGKNHIYIDDLISKANQHIEDHRAKKAQSEFKIRATLSSELQALRANFENRTSIAQINRDSSRNRTYAANDRSSSLVEVQESKLSGLLGFLAGKSILIVLLISMIYEIARQRNEIYPTPVFESLDFEPGALSQIISIHQKAFWYEQLNKARTKVLPKLIEPSNNSKVYDTSFLNPEIVRKEDDSTLPNPGTSSGEDIEQIEAEIKNLVKQSEQLRSEGKADEAEQIELTANSLIHTYFSYMNIKYTPDDVLQFREKAKAYLSGESKENPFEVRRSIGFFVDRSNPGYSSGYNGSRYNDKIPAANIGKVGTDVRCMNCSNVFTKTVWNKVYCSGKCKEEYHANLHGGTKFDPSLFRKNKK